MKTGPTRTRSALWVYQTAYTGLVSFWIRSSNADRIQIPSLRIQVQERLSEKESEKIRLATLCELEEHRIANILQLELEQ